MEAPLVINPARGGLRWPGEVAATLALALPIAATNLGQFALLLTETAILGRLGTEPLAAASLGVNVFWALMAPILGLGIAAAPLLAQARGAGRRAGSAGRGWLASMRASLRAGLWAVLLVSVPLLVPLWHAEALLLAAGQSPVLAALAGEYLRGLLPALPCFGVFIVLRSLLAALERPRAALWVTLGAIVVNALVCAGLVFGLGGLPRLGVLGAGIAGSVADAFMAGGLLLYVARARGLRRLRLLCGGSWWPDRGRLRAVFVIGLPIAGQMLLEIGLFSAAALAIGWLGAAAVAAHAIAVQVAGTTFMVPMGVAQAATARVGLAAGAGDAAGAVRAGWVAIGLGAAFMAMTATLLVAGGTALPPLFLGEAEGTREVAVLAASLLVVAGVFQLADGVQVVAAGALRGLSDTRVPMVLAGVGYWGIGLPAGLLLGWPAGLGALGVWIGLALGLAVVAALMLFRWRRVSRSG